jgi:hypothetical protein
VSTAHNLVPVTFGARDGTINRAERDLQLEDVMVKYSDESREAQRKNVTMADSRRTMRWQEFLGIRAFSIRSFSCAELLGLLTCVHFLLRLLPYAAI